MEVTPMGQIFYRTEADSAVPRGCTCHDRSGSCDWCQIYYNGPGDELNFESRLKPYSINAVCDAMLREASRALRAHDLAETRFWQDGYLSIRPIVKTEVELASYLGAREMARV